MIRNDATARQVEAADPLSSTWLSANAGSGKTRVLTDRVARLLLKGVYPQHILCLTYTKAAASEMQNRLFQRLGEWAMLDEGELRAKLLDLGVEEAVSNDTLRDARRLFARAIETPGGLKIQTIHSFCSSLLRRFPLEAGVSPQFVEMDDRAAKRLRDDILEDIADGPDRDAFDGIARYFADDALDKLCGEISTQRAHFMPPASEADIWAALELPAGFDEAALLAEVFLGGEAELLGKCVEIFRTGGPNDNKAADKLAKIAANPVTLAGLGVLEDVFLTGPKTKSPFSAKIGSLPTKGTQKAMGPLLDHLENLMRRVEAARDAHIALGAARKTAALHRFAGVFLPEYTARKMAHGWLDFDDLILKARDLLTDPSVAEWVLYRLDGGIDHVLVDEAQDTSPVQWSVIDLLTTEFTAGDGARDETRTVFVVGDKKQSIYSFQGADPDGFERMADTFEGRFAAIGSRLMRTELEYSFRSSVAVLSTVDATFHPGARQGMGKTVHHLAFKTGLPGRVDLWPVIEKVTDPEKPDWTSPLDVVSDEHHDAQLARRVAEDITRMIREETLDHNGKRRPVQAGDILILVRRRSDLFHEIIRACKAAGLPIAGADRLKLGGEIAVKDISALLSFLATPEDSLSLAAVLRSPLFGWSEDDLYRLAAKRDEKYLWETLRKRKERHPDTYAMLDALLGDADFLRPYDLIERVLTRHKGRENLIARLGDEVEDGIDALLSQALAYERMEVPSLTGFISWLEGENVEIKRQLDSAGNRIRVMTVHGSKGLESPIVIMPDTGPRGNNPQGGAQVLTTGSVPLSRLSKDIAPPQVTAAVQDETRKQQEEDQRLLYVAMTRAEQWLIVGAAGDIGKGDTWYEKVMTGLNHAGAVDHNFWFGAGRRLEHGQWSGPAADTATDDTKPRPALPEWVRRDAVRPEKPAPVLTPSTLGGAKIVIGGDDGLEAEEAKRRGTLLHMLLENLPDHAPDDWADVTETLFSGLDLIPDAAQRAELLAEASQVLTAPHLADLFAQPALQEVDLTAALPQVAGKRMHGTIDRLVIYPDRILAIDYKSNAVVPASADDVPEGILRQMGAYASALQQIYPDRAVETAILWTRDASLMPLSPQSVAAALARIATS